PSSRFFLRPPSRLFLRPPSRFFLRAAGRFFLRSPSRLFLRATSRLFLRATGRFFLLRPHPRGFFLRPSGLLLRLASLLLGPPRRLRCLAALLWGAPGLLVRTRAAGLLTTAAGRAQARPRAPLARLVVVLELGAAFEQLPRLAAAAARARRRRG